MAVDDGSERLQHLARGLVKLGLPGIATCDEVEDFSDVGVHGTGDRAPSIGGRQCLFPSGVSFLRSLFVIQRFLISRGLFEATPLPPTAGRRLTSEIEIVRPGSWGRDALVAWIGICTACRTRRGRRVPREVRSDVFGVSTWSAAARRRFGRCGSTHRHDRQTRTSRLPSEATGLSYVPTSDDTQRMQARTGDATPSSRDWDLCCMPNATRASRPQEIEVCVAGVADVADPGYIKVESGRAYLVASFPCG